MRGYLESIVCVLLFCAVARANAESPVEYVDPFIGTGYHGHTFPGAVVPHGMVQVSPDTRTQGWDACGGYHYDDNSIIGFSQTHLSGTGVSDMGDFLLMPCVGKFHLQSGTPEDPDSGYRSRFSHDSEIATPGYYKVDLKDYGITAELSATQRVALHRYTFPEAEDAHIMLDFVHQIYGNGKETLGSKLNVVNDQLITGYRNTKGWAKNRHIYFAARFSKPFKSYAVFDGQERLDNQPELSSKLLRSVFNFQTKQGEAIIVKMADLCCFEPRTRWRTSTRKFLAGILTPSVRVQATAGTRN